MLGVTRFFFLRRLSWTMHSTLSQRQFPQGAPSTTSHRTLRARHDTQARAARRFVTLCGGSEPSSADARFFDLSLGRPLVEEALSAGSGEGDIDGEVAFTAESSRAACDDIVAACEVDAESKKKKWVNKKKGGSKKKWPLCMYPRLYMWMSQCT